MRNRKITLRYLFEYFVLLLLLAGCDGENICGSEGKRIPCGNETAVPRPEGQSTPTEKPRQPIRTSTPLAPEPTEKTQEKMEDIIRQVADVEEFDADMLVAIYRTVIQTGAQGIRPMGIVTRDMVLIGQDGNEIRFDQCGQDQNPMLPDEDCRPDRSDLEDPKTQVEYAIGLLRLYQNGQADWAEAIEKYFGHEQWMIDIFNREYDSLKRGEFPEKRNSLRIGTENTVYYYGRRESFMA